MGAVADVSGGRSTPTPEPVREWCCRTPLTVPHVPGCSFEPRPDNPIDYSGPAVVARPPVGDTTEERICEICEGTGPLPQCGHCHGTGQKTPSTINSELIVGATQPQPTDEPPDSVCDVCHGAKRIYWADDSTECSTCEGTGSIPSGQKRFRVWMTREESARIDAVFGAVELVRELANNLRHAPREFVHAETVADNIISVLDKAGCP